jgi:hypothetical protein
MDPEEPFAGIGRAQEGAEQDPEDQANQNVSHDFDPSNMWRNVT